MTDVEKCEEACDSILSETVVDDRELPPCASESMSSLKAPSKCVLEGDSRAWLTVFGAFLALFCTFGQLNAFGTFQSWYAEHQLQHLSPSTISWIGSLQLWLFFFSGGFVGRIFDSYGPRVIMIPGTVVLTFSIMMTSISTEYYQYVLSQGVLFGLGVGMLFYPSLAAISTHFSKYRATALGIAAAGSGLGGVIYPIMFQQLFAKVGFAWATRIAGLTTLIMCAVAVLTVTSGHKRHSGPWFDTKMFKDVCFMLVVIASVSISIGLFIPFFYIVDYATDHGVSPSIAFYVLSVMNAGSVFGRIAPSFLSDIFGRFNLLVPCAFLAGLSVLVIWPFSQSIGVMMLFAVVYGFFSGAFNALIVPCIAQISQPHEMGTRIGILYSLLSFPSLCGGPAAGALLKHDGESYTGMIVLSGTTVVIGSLLMLWARFKFDSRTFARV